VQFDRALAEAEALGIRPLAELAHGAVDHADRV
jgi:hypothetical protein